MECGWVCRRGGPAAGRNFPTIPEQETPPGTKPSTLNSILTQSTFLLPNFLPRSQQTMLRPHENTPKPSKFLSLYFNCFQEALQESTQKQHVLLLYNLKTINAKSHVLQQAILSSCLGRNFHDTVKKKKSLSTSCYTYHSPSLNHKHSNFINITKEQRPGDTLQGKRKSKQESSLLFISPNRPQH